ALDGARELLAERAVLAELRRQVRLAQVGEALLSLVDQEQILHGDLPFCFQGERGPAGSTAGKKNGAAQCLRNPETVRCRDAGSQDRTASRRTERVCRAEAAWHGACMCSG